MKFIYIYTHILCLIQTNENFYGEVESFTAYSIHLQSVWKHNCIVHLGTEYMALHLCLSAPNPSWLSQVAVLSTHLSGKQAPFPSPPPSNLFHSSWDKLGLGLHSDKTGKCLESSHISPSGKTTNVTPVTRQFSHNNLSDLTESVPITKDCLGSVLHERTLNNHRQTHPAGVKR